MASVTPVTVPGDTAPNGDRVPVPALAALLLSGWFPMFGLFAIGVDFPMVAAAFPDERYGAMLAQLIGGLSGLLFAAGSWWIGGTVERLGPRTVYLAGVVGFAGFGALPAIIDSLPWILVTRCAFGLCVAAVATAGLSGISKLPPARRAKFFGWQTLSAGIGSAICFPLVGMLGEENWRYPFLLHLAALAVIPLAMTISPVAKREPVETWPIKGGNHGIPLPLLIMAAFAGLAMSAGPMFTPFYVLSLGVTDPEAGSTALVVMSIAGLLAATVFGALHVRLGSRGIFALTLLCVAAGSFGAGAARGMVGFTVGMAVMATGLAIFSPNLAAAIAQRTEKPARALASGLAALFAVQAVFPFLAQALSANFGPSSLFTALGATALLFLAVLAIATWRSAHGQRRTVAIASTRQPGDR